MSVNEIVQKNNLLSKTVAESNFYIIFAQIELLTNIITTL